MYDKTEEVEEDAKEEFETEEEKKKDIKLGEIELRKSAVLVIKKVNYKGEDRIDFRVWLDSQKYKGPTKQGFVVSMDKIDEFIEIVEGMKEKLNKLEVKSKKK